MVICLTLPLTSSPFALNLSQYQGLFQWVGSLHQVTKFIGTSASALVLLMNIQDWFSLALTGLISLLSKGLSRVFSSTIVQKHQFFGSQPSLWSSSHILTCLLEKYLAIVMSRRMANSAQGSMLSCNLMDCCLTEEPGGLQSMGSLRVGQDSATSLSHFTFMHWRMKW